MSLYFHCKTFRKAERVIKLLRPLSGVLKDLVNVVEMHCLDRKLNRLWVNPLACKALQE